MNVEEAKRFLRDNGYVVAREERFVILNQQYVMPPEFNTIAGEGFVEHQIKAMACAIGRHALQSGLMVTDDTTALDPVTGRERFLNLAAAFIRPRAS